MGEAFLSLPSVLIDLFLLLDLPFPPCVDTRLSAFMHESVRRGVIRDRW
jgi:hypothetical protein